jgi:Putative O-antigen polymerase
MVSTARQSNGIAVACFVAIACIVAGWLLPGSVDYSNAILLALTVSGVMLAAVLVRYFRADRDLLDPLIVVSASLIFYFGLHTLWLATHTEQTQSGIAFPFAAGLAPSLALLGAGYIVLLVGFSLPRAVPRVMSQLRSWHSPGALVVVFAIGLAGNLAAVASGGYAKTSNLGQAASNVLIYKTLGFTAIIALVVCACQHYSLPDKHSTYRWMMWVMLGILVIFALSVAEKKIAFSAIFAWAASRNYIHAHVRPRQVLIAIVVALFVITPIIQASRGTEALRAVGNQSSLGSVRTTSSTIPQRIKNYFVDFPTEALSGFDIINRRTNGSESLALAYLYTPSQQSFGYGQHWPDIVTSLIPHFIWPSKPVHNDTRQFSEVYGGESQNSGNGLTLAPTLPGDFYMNFGWLGILAGMFAFGVVLKVIANTLWRYSPSFGVAIYVSSMLALVLVEQAAADLGSTMLLQLLAAALTFGLLRLIASPRRLSLRSVAAGDGGTNHSLSRRKSKNLGLGDDGPDVHIPRAPTT